MVTLGLLPSSSRDTTVQTLTLQPSVRDGIITYEDSPLVRLRIPFIKLCGEPPDLHRRV